MKVSARVGPLVLAVVGLRARRRVRASLAGRPRRCDRSLVGVPVPDAPGHRDAGPRGRRVDRPAPAPAPSIARGSGPRLAGRPDRPRHRGRRRLARDPGGMAVRGPGGRRRICAGRSRGDDAGGRGAVRRYRSVPAPGRGRRLRRGDLHGDRGSRHRREPRARRLAVHRPGRAGRPAAVGSRRGHRRSCRSSRSRSPRSAAVARRVGRSRSRRPRTGGTASCSSSPWSGSWPRPRR